jgi:RNA polymerase sigma factor (sigma-70 family)
MDGTESVSGVSDLVNSCIQSDEEAWKAFVLKYTRPISLYILRACPEQTDHETIRDLAQEVFVRLLANDRAALRRLRTTTPEGMLAFLAAVARTVALDHVRRLQSQKRFAQIVPLDDEGDDLPDLSAAQSPEFELLEKLGVERFTGLLQETITGVNSERDIFVAQMYFLEELSAAEIANIRGLNLSVSAVEAVIHRIRKVLRTKRMRFP